MSLRCVGNQLLQTAPSPLLAGASTASLSFWIRLNPGHNVSNPNGVEIFGDAGGKFSATLAGSGGLQLRWSSTGGGSSCALTLAPGTSYHVAATWQDGSQRYYLNGVPARSDTQAGPIGVPGDASPHPYRLGSDSAGVDATLGDPTLWVGHALSPQEVAGLRDRAVPPSGVAPSSIALRWSLSGPDSAPAKVGDPGLADLSPTGLALSSVVGAAPTYRAADLSYVPVPAIGRAAVSGSGESIVLSMQDGAGLGTTIGSIYSGNEVQSVAVSGTTVSGTFRLAFGAQTTGPIAFTASPPSDYGLFHDIPVVAGHTYKVSGCWPTNPYRTAHAHAEVIQADGTIAADHDYNNIAPPSGPADAGVNDINGTPIPWETYGVVTPTSSTLSVRITGAFSGGGENLVVDAIRVEDQTAHTVAYYDDSDAAHCLLHSDSQSFANGNLLAVSGQANCYGGSYSEFRYGGLGIYGTLSIDAVGLKAALEALPGIGPGNVAVDGTGRVEFVNALGGVAQPLLTAVGPFASTSRVTAGGSVATLSINGGAAIPLNAPWIVGRPGRTSSWALLPLHQATPRTTLKVNQVPMTRTPLYATAPNYLNWADSRVDPASVSKFVLQTNQAGDHADFPFQGLQDGTYRFAVTFVADPSLSTAATFQILDQGGNILQTAHVDQTVAPADFVDSGHSWKYVGTPIAANYLNYWFTVRMLSAGDAVRIDAVQLVPDPGNAPSLIIPPGALATLTIPAGLITTAAGPIPACTVALDNHSGGSTLAPIDPATVTMPVGYNAYFQGYVSSLIQYSNLALKMDRVSVAPGNYSNVASVNADSFPTAVIGNTSVSMIVSEPALQLGNGRAFLNAPNGLYTLEWSGAAGAAVSNVILYGSMTLVSEDLTGATKKRIYRVVPDGSSYAPSIRLIIGNVGPDPADPTGNTPWAGTIPKFHPAFLSMCEGSKCFRFLDAMRGNSNAYADISQWPTPGQFSKGSCKVTVAAPVLRIEQGDASRDEGRMLVLKVTTKVPHDLYSGCLISLKQCGTAQMSAPLGYGDTSRNLGDGGFDIALAEVVDATTLMLHFSAGYYYSAPPTPITMTNVATPANGWLQADIGPCIGLDDIVDLCNIVPTVEHCWINTSACATTACIAAIGDYLAAHLRPGIKVHHEIGNEDWNYGLYFEGYPWFRLKSFQMTGDPNSGYLPAYAAVGDLHHRTMAASFAAAGRPGDYVYTWGSQQGGGISGAVASAVHALTPPGRLDELCVGGYFNSSDVENQRQVDVMTVEQDVDLLETFIEDPGFTWTVSDRDLVRAVYPSAAMVIYEMSPEAGIVPNNAAGTLNVARSLNRCDAIHRHPRMGGIYIRQLKRMQDEGVTLANQYHIGGDTSQGRCYSTFEWYGQQRGTGNPAIDTVNVSDPQAMDSAKSEVGGAIYRWNSMIARIKPLLRNGRSHGEATHGKSIHGNPC